MFTFRNIELPNDSSTIISFRKDSYTVSFGDASQFGNAWDYLKKIENRLQQFPGGLVIVEHNNQAVGQIEMQIKEYEFENIGYVNLFYLIPEYRGKGMGSELIGYAERFFASYNIMEYQLRAAITNARALNFYNKHGFRILRTEETETSHPRYRLGKAIFNENGIIL
jgi:ribosomal protein S18 acetylase RimI-like enzyme